MLAGLAIFDRAIPTMLRMYGFDVLPFGDAEKVARFKKSYGLVSFPRTALLVLCAALIGAMDFWHVNLLPILGGVCLLVWLCAALRDVYRARRMAEGL